MLSAYSGAEPAALATGAADCLAKPFEREELLAKVMSYGSAFDLSRSFENQTGSRRKLVITQKSVVITDVNNTRGEVKEGSGALLAG
jgi:DNA-binding response OmpR family regulator